MIAGYVVPTCGRAPTQNRHLRGILAASCETRVRLRADMDLIIAFSACPMDLLPINGLAGKPTEAHFRIET